jgi:formylglycine-generating enzyme required for sulfatase activity
VREDGEPTRRRAPRSEFSEDEWRLVSKLADYPNRLLVTVASEAGETYAEVAHEAIFRRWDRLREWIATEREFLAWRSGLEAARRAWQATPDASKHDALLMGAALMQAQSWLAQRADDLPAADCDFIFLSRKMAQRRKLRARALVGVLVAVIVAVLAGWWKQDALKERYYWHTVMGSTLLTAKQEREKAATPGSEFEECRRGCPTMIVVPAGRFMMGSLENEPGRSPDEGPQHEVTIATPFAVSKTEVTFAQWDACIAAAACSNVSDSTWGQGIGGSLPVINVSWHQAKQYAAWLSRITGRDYRLLTEAEWEYAARAGSSADEAEVQLDQYAWYGINSDGKTHPVAGKKANAFGLYDMQGNVAEWCEDLWHAHYDGAPIDGSPWLQDGDDRRRVLRGGSWFLTARDLRVAYRDWDFVDDQNDNLGFRLARTLRR